MLRHTRRLLTPWVACLAVVIAVVVPTVPATASTSAVTVGATSGCGALKAVTPTGGHVTDPAAVADALGLPSSDPLLTTSARTHARWASTVICKARPGVTHVAQSTSGTSNSDYDTANWSGYINYPASGTYWVTASWTVPTVTINGNLFSAYSSIWPGMGGFNGEGGELIQDGTEQDYYCGSIIHGTCESAAYSYYFWLELYPIEDELEVTNLVPSPGDSVAAYAEWTASTGEADFELCDYTQNACVAGEQASPAPGASAEWVVERPTVNGSFSNLADYGQVTLSGGEYATSTTADPISAGTANSIDMVNGSDLLSTPGALNSTGDGFTTTWVNFS